MTGERLYSIRMRASDNGRHVSGAERIVPHERVRGTVDELLTRPLAKGTRPDRMSVSIDEIDPDRIHRVQALDLVMLDTADTASARRYAARVLERSGVAPQVAQDAIALLAAGPGPAGSAMRGAAIMDARTGARLEEDRTRGVRATRFDWSESGLQRINVLLGSVPLAHFRLREALALASKAAHAPGIVAELCWSDDPDYTAGYVAAKPIGYVRFPRIKEPGISTGGRVFFVRDSSIDLKAFTRYLREVAVLIDEPGTFHGVQDPDCFIASLSR